MMSFDPFGAPYDSRHLITNGMLSSVLVSLISTSMNSISPDFAVIVPPPSVSPNPCFASSTWSGSSYRSPRSIGISLWFSWAVTLKGAPVATGWLDVFLCFPGTVTFMVPETVARRVCSHIELEQQSVPILHHIVAALVCVVAGFARVAHRTRVHQILPPHAFGLDEAALEIRMNPARRLRRARARRHGPGANFLFVEGEKSSQAQQLIRVVDQRAHAGLLDAEFRQVLPRFLSGEVRQIAFQLRAQRDGVAGVMRAGVVADFGHVRIRLGGGQFVFLHVCGEERRSRGQQETIPCPLPFLLDRKS